MIKPWKRNTVKFVGSRNQLKARVLSVLWFELGNPKRNPKGMSTRELAERIGRTPGDVAQRISHWANYGLVIRRLAIGKSNKPAYRYTLAAGGKHWVRDLMPRELFETIVKELREREAQRIKTIIERGKEDVR